MLLSFFNTQEMQGICYRAEQTIIIKNNIQMLLQMHQMILLYLLFHTRYFTFVSRQQKVDSRETSQMSRFLHYTKQVDQKCNIHCLPQAIQCLSFTILCFQKMPPTISNQKQYLITYCISQSNTQLSEGDGL